MRLAALMMARTEAVTVLRSMPAPKVLPATPSMATSIIAIAAASARSSPTRPIIAASDRIANAPRE